MDKNNIKELEEAALNVLSAIHSNNLSEAERISFQCAKNFPNHPDSHYLIAKVHEAQSNTEQALNAYSNAIQLDYYHTKSINALNRLFCNLPALEERHAPILSQLLNCMQDLNYGAQYIPLSTRAIAKFGFNKNLLLYMGEVHEKLHDFNEAMDCYTQIIQHEPNNIPCRIRMADIFLAHGQTQDTLTYSKSALELGSQSNKAKFLHTLSAEDNEVLNEFTKLFMSSSDNPHMNFYMNYYKSMAGQFSINLLLLTVKAQEELAPLMELFHNYLSNINKTNKDILQKFQDCYKLKTQSFDTAQLLIAQTALMIGNFKLALKSFESIREYFPESPIAELGLAIDRLLKDDKCGFEEHRNKSIEHKLNSEMSLSDPINQRCDTTNEALASISLEQSSNQMLREFFPRIISHTPIETYFEITGGAESLLYLNNNPNITCRYVSSRNLEIVNQYTNSVGYTTHPNNFFTENNFDQIFNGKKIDIAYISFKNNFHQILGNIVDTSAHMSSKGIMCIANTFPFDPVSSSPIRRTAFWLGETWKVILAIKKYCPDLKVETYKVHPGGLSILSNFSKDTGNILKSSYPEMISDFENMKYSDIYKNKDELFSTQSHAEDFFRN